MCFIFVVVAVVICCVVVTVVLVAIGRHEKLKSMPLWWRLYIEEAEIEGRSIVRVDVSEMD